MKTDNDDEDNINDAFWDIQLCEDSYKRADAASLSELAPPEIEDLYTNRQQQHHHEENYDVLHQFAKKEEEDLLYNWINVNVYNNCPSVKYFSSSLSQSETDLAKNSNSSLVAVTEESLPSSSSSRKPTVLPAASNKLGSVIPLQFRTTQNVLSLSGSYVGEQVWDAAKLFCTYLILEANTVTMAKTVGAIRKNERNQNVDGYAYDCTNEDEPESNVTFSTKTKEKLTLSVQGRRVHELGAGCGVIGMCAAALGASDVLCSDYIPQVLNNLAFNMKHNAGILEKITTINDDDNVKRNEDHGGTRSNTRSSDINKGDHLINRQTILKWGELDWKELASKDLQEAEWTSTGGSFNRSMASAVAKNSEIIDPGQYVEKTDDKFYLKDCKEFVADVLVGSALVYSAEGGLFCADTIHHFFSKHGTKEAWLIQMSERPGFDRFLLRLEHWNITFEKYEISDEVYDMAISNLGKIATPREAYHLYIIIPGNKK